jgi:hypothetical protein
MGCWGVARRLGVADGSGANASIWGAKLGLSEAMLDRLKLDVEGRRWVEHVMTSPISWQPGAMRQTKAS